MIRKITTKAFLLGLVLSAVTLVPNLGHSRISSNRISSNRISSNRISSNGATKPSAPLGALLQNLAAKPLAGK